MEVFAMTLRYIFDTFYYMLVVVSWRLQLIWDRLDSSSKGQEALMEQPTIATNKQYNVSTARMKRQLLSRKASTQSSTLHNRDLSRKTFKTPLHLGKNLFGSCPSDLNTSWDPNKTFFVSYYKYDHLPEDLPLGAM